MDRLTVDFQFTDEEFGELECARGEIPRQQIFARPFEK